MAKTKTTNMDDLVQQTQPEVVKANNDKVKILELFTKKFGNTPNFSHINPVNIFDNRWRVNIYTKTQGFITKFTIHKSFYVIMDKEGMTTSPKI